MADGFPCDYVFESLIEEQTPLMHFRHDAGRPRASFGRNINQLHISHWVILGWLILFAEPTVLARRLERCGLPDARHLRLAAFLRMRYRAEQGECGGPHLCTGGVTQATDEGRNLSATRRLEDVLNNTTDARASLDGGTTLAEGTTFADDSLTQDLPVSRLTVPPEDDRLPEVFAFLEPLAQRPGCTPQMGFALELVCEELFANICHYAFPAGHERTPVTFEAAADDERGILHLAVIDDGIEYNPLTHKSEKLSPDGELRVGGMGILLVRKTMDSVDYERADGKNILRMTKRYV